MAQQIKAIATELDNMNSISRPNGGRKKWTNWRCSQPSTKKDSIRQHTNSTNRLTLCGGIIILLYLFLATVDFYWQDLEFLGWHMQQINLPNDVYLSSVPLPRRTLVILYCPYNSSMISAAWIMADYSPIAQFPNKIIFQGTWGLKLQHIF